MTRYLTRRGWGALVLALALAAVAGCKTGGGTALSVVEATPAADATGVSTGTAIQVAFNLQLDMLTVTGTTFQVTDAAGAAVAGTLTNGDTAAVVVFTPTALLNPGTAYTVTLTTGIVSSLGTTLASNASWSFTTAALPVVAVNSGTSCAIKDDSGLYCWGFNTNGEVGDGSTTERHAPVQVGSIEGWSTVAGGPTGTHFCGIMTTGMLFCWGRNDSGQLGDATQVNRSSPAKVGTASDWTAVSAGGQHSCGIRGAGTLWCWGDNENGQLGQGTTTDSSVPLQVGTDADWKSVSAGSMHTCAVKGAGLLFCWGLNSTGQLGIGSTTNAASPAPVGSDADWLRVASGGSHTCAAKASGALFCWGWNIVGQLGNGTTSADPTTSPPSTPVIPTASTVSAGFFHTCAVTDAGTGCCWGSNGEGQLGDGTTTDRSSPVSFGTGIAVAAAGGMHSCARTTEGNLYCWGDNSAGQLGDGTTTDSPVPKEISGF